jgi:SNF family Na+-dependent transporter
MYTHSFFQTFHTLVDNHTTHATGSLQVWIKAGQQVFFSLGVSYGTHTTFASYNNRDHNFLYDVFWVPIINAATSFFAGFAVFGTLGYLSHKYGVEVSDLEAGGFGLAFQAYPAALSLMVAPNFFSFMFFFMIILLAIDSQFAFVETVVSAVVEADLLVSFPPTVASFSSFTDEQDRAGKEEDQNQNQHKTLMEKSKARRKFIITIAVCVVFWLLGFCCICQGGLYFIQVLDDRAIGFTLFAVAGCELFSISYVYGIDCFVHDCQQMIGLEVSGSNQRTFEYFKFCWKYISPSLCLCLVIGGIVNMVESAHDYGIVCYDVEEKSTCKAEEVQWGIDLGTALAVISCSFIPLGAAWEVWGDWYPNKSSAAASSSSSSSSSPGSSLETVEVEMNNNKLHEEDNKG